MRYTNRFRVVPVVWICAFALLLLGSCEKEDGVNLPLSGGTNGDNDPVFSADGGFVITHKMLDTPYNKITFPGTHNSFAGPNWLQGHTGCENQQMYVSQQLKYGVRYIEFDIGSDGKVYHGCLLCPQSGEYWLGEYFQDVRRFVEAHPHQIVTVRISDLVDCVATNCFPFTPQCSYEIVNGILERNGLDAYIYNWDATKAIDDSARCYIPDPWPTLGEMIDSGKTVMFFHSRLYPGHGVIDEGYLRNLRGENWFWGGGFDLEDLCKLTPVWEPPKSRQQEGADRLFLIECDPDRGASAGDAAYAARNNDGRKLYQLAKQHETEILPDQRAVNFIIIDYFGVLNGLPIDIKDACNRLNYERIGSDWANSEAFVEFIPYEFDNSKVEYLSQIPDLQAEVDEVLDDLRTRISSGGDPDLSGYETVGQIVSTGCNSDLPHGLWTRLPEFALDGDFFTRWCGWDDDGRRAWGIDLGERKEVDEIAIAWEFPQKRPRFVVYASNDDSKFADGISHAELMDDAGWVEVADADLVVSGTLRMWRQLEFRDTGTSSWRYIKIAVNGGGHVWPSFYEARLYGPAN